MTNEELSSMVRRLAASTIRLHARCDALELTIPILAKQLDLDPLKLGEAIVRATDVRHQVRLQEIEDKNPALAASLDFRPSELPPDLFD